MTNQTIYSTYNFWYSMLLVEVQKSSKLVVVLVQDGY